MRSEIFLIFILAAGLVAGCGGKSPEQLAEATVKKHLDGYIKDYAEVPTTYEILEVSQLESKAHAEDLIGNYKFWDDEREQRVVDRAEKGDVLVIVLKTEKALGTEIKVRASILCNPDGSIKYGRFY